MEEGEDGGNKLHKVARAVIYAFLVFLLANVVAYSFEQYEITLVELPWWLGGGTITAMPLASFAQSVRLIGLTVAFIVFAVALMRQKQQVTKVRGLK